MHRSTLHFISLLNFAVFGVKNETAKNVSDNFISNFDMLQNFSVAIFVSPHVCFILVLILISVFLR